MPTDSETYLVTVDVWYDVDPQYNDDRKAHHLQDPDAEIEIDVVAPSVPKASRRAEAIANQLTDAERVWAWSVEDVPDDGDGG